MASLVWNAIDHMNEARANKPASHGLFSDESSQLDLVEMFQD